MSDKARPSVGSRKSSDPGVEEIARWFESQKNGRDRFRWVLRIAVDRLLDGERTGRWCYQQLTSTEKTHLGTVVEIDLTEEFQISQEGTLDWQILGTEIDCKFSRNVGGWEIPPKMYVFKEDKIKPGDKDHLALLVWLCDDSSQWAAGVFRCIDSLLSFRADGSRGFNSDNKRRLSEAGLEKIRWLWDGLHDDLPRNMILAMEPEIRHKVLTPPSGQARINALFMQAEGTIVNRATVFTVAQQADSMKRARDARLPEHLGDKGYLILGHQNSDPHIAKQLGLEVPVKGELISCLLTEAKPNEGVWLGDGWYKRGHDPTNAPNAPLGDGYLNLSPDELRNGRANEA